MVQVVEELLPAALAERAQQIRVTVVALVVGLVAVTRLAVVAVVQGHSAGLALRQITSLPAVTAVLVSLPQSPERQFPVLAAAAGEGSARGDRVAPGVAVLVGLETEAEQPERSTPEAVAVAVT